MKSPFPGFLKAEAEEILVEAHRISNSKLPTPETCLKYLYGIKELIDNPAPGSISLRGIGVKLEEGGYKGWKEWNYSVDSFEKRVEDSLEESENWDGRRESLNKIRANIKTLSFEMKEKVRCLIVQQSLQQFLRDIEEHQKAIYSIYRNWCKKLQEYQQRFPYSKGKYPIFASETEYDTSPIGHARFLSTSAELLYPKFLPRKHRERVIENLKKMEDIRKDTLQKIIKSYSESPRNPIGGHPKMWEDYWKEREGIYNYWIIANAVVNEKFCPPVAFLYFFTIILFPRKILENYESLGKFKSPLANPYIRRREIEVFNNFYQALGLKTKSPDELVGNLTPTYLV